MALWSQEEVLQVFVDLEGNMVLNNPVFFEKWKEKWLKEE